MSSKEKAGGSEKPRVLRILNLITPEDVKDMSRLTALVKKTYLTHFLILDLAIPHAYDPELDKSEDQTRLQLEQDLLGLNAEEVATSSPPVALEKKAEMTSVQETEEAEMADVLGVSLIKMIQSMKSGDLIKLKKTLTEGVSAVAPTDVATSTNARLTSADPKPIVAKQEVGAQGDGPDHEPDQGSQTRQEKKRGSAPAHSSTHTPPEDEMFSVDFIIKEKQKAQANEVRLKRLNNFSTYQKSMEATNKLEANEESENQINANKGLLVNRK